MTVSKGFLLGKLLPRFVTESLDSDGSLVVAAAGGADLSTLDITDVVGTDGNPGDLLQSLGNGLSGWQPNASLSYSLKVTYDGADVDSVQELPIGWTLDSQTADTIVLSHNTGRTIKNVSYLIYDDGTLSLVDSGNATSPSLEAKDKVTLIVDADTTGSQSSSYAYVNLQFQDYTWLLILETYLSYFNKKNTK